MIFTPPTPLLTPGKGSYSAHHAEVKLWSLVKWLQLLLSICESQKTIKMKRSARAAESDSYVTAAKQPKLTEDGRLHVGKSQRLAVKCQQYDKPFPYFRKPSEVGSFSQDCKRTFHHDRRQLKYYVKPAAADPCFDLGEGYRSFIRKDESVKEYLDDLLKWVILNEDKFVLQSDKEKSSKKTSIERYTLC